MKALVSWLRDLVEIPDGVSIDALAHALHMSGFELAGIEPSRAVAEGRDAVVDFEITANRPDTLSVIGLAREISALYDTPLRGAAALALAGASGLNATPHNSEASGLKVTIEDPALCPRYAAAVADITIGPSPAWLAARLTAAGIRSINNIVDITNYVLIETGHPLHAFDLALLEGPHLKIRRAKPGEKVKTLDGQERTLAEDMLVIADASRAQAVAGVMGGGDSEVSEKTRTIALESAYFTPSSIRRTSKRLGLSTEASYRFERGADPEAPARALARACELIEQIGAGKVRPDWIDARATTRTPVVLTLRHEQIARHPRVCGAARRGRAHPDAARVRAVVRAAAQASGTASAGAGMAAPVGASGRGLVWQVTVPSWRVDVTREIDLIEEVARVYGYDRFRRRSRRCARCRRRPMRGCSAIARCARCCARPASTKRRRCRSSNAARRSTSRPKRVDRRDCESAVGEVRGAAAVAAARARRRARLQPAARAARHPPVRIRELLHAG